MPNPSIKKQRLIVDPLLNKDNNHAFLYNSIGSLYHEYACMKLSELNQLDDAKAGDAFNRCCSASRWVKQMVSARPFCSKSSIQKDAIRFWKPLQSADYMEAFAGHPKIGDLDFLKKKHSNTLAANEQSSVERASNEVLQDLARYNGDYEAKFGYIFIVCATGKTAIEMLSLIKTRINHQADAEIIIAAAEQAKITTIRIDNLIATE